VTSSVTTVKPLSVFGPKVVLIDLLHGSVKTWTKGNPFEGYPDFLSTRFQRGWNRSKG
jgi:hypothetical protein